MSSTLVRFHNALNVARQFALDHGHEFKETILVRDMFGRISLAIENNLPVSTRVEFSRALHLQLGAFSPGETNIFLVKDELFDPKEIFESSDKLLLSDGLFLLDNGVVGADWLRQPIPSKKPRPPRATLYGIKGGVGRSTALVLWARYLAQHEKKRVLVIDLDLESPGVSSSMLNIDARPTYGVVDWFVEEAVGQADDGLLREMVATSPLSQGTEGEVRVVPAGGSSGCYMEKLARVYAELPNESNQAFGFGERLARLIDALEELERPDIVLLDSRAGIHDIAAISVTRLGAVSFLFAVDSPQTWFAYHELFEHWRGQPRLLKEFREKLQIVAAQVPETNRTDYLTRLTEHAYDLFADNVYEEKAANSEDDAFSFNVNDEDAPHYPFPIYWGREFQDFDPYAESKSLGDEQIAASYGIFLKRATELVFSAEIQ